jgi:hypothetical protein
MRSIVGKHSIEKVRAIEIMGDVVDAVVAPLLVEVLVQRLRGLFTVEPQSQWRRHVDVAIKMLQHPVNLNDFTYLFLYY